MAWGPLSVTYELRNLGSLPRISGWAHHGVVQMACLWICVLQECKLGEGRNFFFKFLVYIGVPLIKNAVIVSGVQQSDSGRHVSFLFQILFPFRSLHSIEQTSLCCPVGACWLSILNIAVCTCPSHTEGRNFY